MEKCFREIQIIPHADELFSDGESCIPVNRVGEPYEDTYSYFDTHFRLIREDLLSSYRRSIEQLRTGSHHGEYRNGLKGSWHHDFQLYTSVKYIGVQAGRVGVEYGVSFDANVDVNWEKSKLLMNNSLLCVSQDGFMTFFWATVCNTDKLYQSIVGIRAVDGHELNLQTGVLYSMFESTNAYYEAYEHVLKVLQRPYMDCIHFIQQLVYLEFNIPEPEVGFNIDWKRVCKCDTLDESQEAAIHQALTKNLAIIQGPPGSGKTYTGLLIVKELIAKVKDSCGPILIVCYTNRALDQFLEGIYAYEKGLARLGSRTQSTLLQNRTLNKLMRREKKKKIKGSSNPVIPEELYIRMQNAAKEAKQLSRIFHDKCLRGFKSRDELSSLSSDYSDACSRLQEAKRGIHVCFLSKFKVLGMTSTFAARHHELLVGLNSQVMVVEEAAEVLEGKILGCLNPYIKHLILIGDHMQLRPSVASQKLVTEHKLDVSMFERLVTSGIQYKTLELQRRMRPAISAPLISNFYPMLRDHPSVHGFEDVIGVKENVFFMDHNYPEDPCTGSRSNALEGDMVIEFCLYLTNCCGYKPQDITILCMYRSQTDKVMRKISTSYHLPWGHWLHKNRINPDDYVPKVRSVDEFQGEESNIILLSLVRNINSNSDAKHPQSIGFLGIPNRICVALSRARIGLYIFGNARLLCDHSQVWRNIIQHFARNGCLGNGISLACARHCTDGDGGYVVYQAEDMREYRKGQQNVCTKKCNEILLCGHRCPMKCHFGGHDSFKCKAKCKKKLADCGHVCRKKCHTNSNDQDCVPCLRCVTTNKISDSLSKLVLY